ncbi:ArsR/SmtB family transcription factor [Peribacillus castrilensis]|uniref:ArsR family transcriptional regulator n=1 Tax=Peribacillus simplex TaxID=1478 RepID=A0AAN2PJ67_9BACI|nr:MULTISPECIES: metalloregulator ArsR/SmtB family transcription factor [Bacillaceae]MCF7621943.1 helix-turn-helix domain-containing protein [Peribacillus frigoritolerans]MCP1156060.1 helix-turn-helix domain-containing protein [Peribacillus frigoritolerans]MCT1392023.1 helix-turn-helix domain-containing protein [Peribacillus frigoritolerans]PAL11287.1 transcriptional regulator [Peribacillus simplex]PRA73237.1 transcriptional regulator [Peribacillus simplex]
MDIIEIFKALSNEKRLLILKWLKEPENYFTLPISEGVSFEKEGVCVSQLHHKLNVTQSTASQYLTMLHRTGLLEATRKGKWTYYKRNEEVIKEIGNYIAKEI